MSTPQSTIYVCSGVRLDNRYDHSIYFPDAEAQQEYFAGKVVKTFLAYSYLRKSWPLQVEATMEQAKTWNYLYFRNGTGKMYYYFIVNVEYKNDHMVELSLELDVLQTYLFDFDLLNCMVERQHTLSDAPGEHTVDEGLDVGDVTTYNTQIIDPGAFCIMVMSTINPMATSEETAVPALPYMYDRVFSGVKFWAVDASDWVEWGNQLDKLTEIGQPDAILAMWMYPKDLVRLGPEESWDNDNLVHVVQGAVSMTGSATETTISRPTALHGYTPKNKKLLCYPYNFVMATNNQGKTAVYRYERATGGTIKFRMSGALGPEAGVHLVPADYNGAVLAYNESMELGNYPTCAWNSDTYKLWLAQNQNSYFNAVAGSALKIVGGAGLAVLGAMGVGSGIGAVAGVSGVAGGVAMASSGLSQAANLVAQHGDKEIEPPQARGGFSTTNNITNGRHTFDLYRTQVTVETARILDDFFTMYGYKINRVQKPILNARPAFTYVKTVGCKIAGNMCTADIVAIESIFDRGLTWWKNGDRVADYTQTNTV